MADDKYDSLVSDEDLPVVARLVIEIRSDGTRTVARGAMEDTRSGQRVAINARGGTPLELASGLARQMFKLPGMVLRAASPWRRLRGGSK